VRERRVKELFDRALDEPAARRGAFLDRACGPRTRQAVERLLDAHTRSAGFLERCAAEALAGEVLAPGTQLGSYTVENVLGAGGGGTIYRARQAKPQRRVALKVMAGGFVDAAARRRFLEEAEILARLRHPGIAVVYEAGVHEEVSYLALEYVEGARTLTRYAREAALDRRARLALMARVCDAVHHGHQKGVIHRDLKPGNVLVDAAGQPRVIDFGIARVTGRGTRGVELAGTLPYMSPEQCDAGADLDIRCDVYALGVMLYEILHDRLPIDLDHLPFPEAARRIRAGQIRPVDPSLRGDVEAILARALAHRREDRYGSAAALGDDIERHLAHRAVAARAASPLYHLGRFARRHRAIFAALVAVVVVSIAAAVVSVEFALARTRASDRAEYNAYLANVAAASNALRANSIAEARQRLDEAPARHRHWEWYHLRGRLDASQRTIEWPRRGIYVADACGDVVAGGCLDHDVRLWSTSGDVRATFATPHVHSIALTDEGRCVAFGHRDGTVAIHGPLGDRTIAAHDAVVNAIGFDPAGRLLATGSSDHTIRVFDVDGMRERAVLRGHDDRVLALAFDPRGERLASGGRDGRIRVWRVADWSAVLDLRAGSTVEDVAWSPDGSLLATGSRDETVRLWSARDGGPRAVWRGHAGNVRSVRFSPDGRRVASGSYDRTVRVWTVGDPEGAIVLRGHTTPVQAVRYLASGTLVSFSWGGRVKFWRGDSSDDVLTLRDPDDMVVAVAFLENGRLASQSLRGAVQVWDVDAQRVVRRVEARPSFFPTIAGGATLVHVRPGGGVDVHGEVLGRQPGPIVADGDRILQWSSRGVVLWDGARRVGPRRAPGTLRAAALRGDRIALGYENGSVEIRDRELVVVARRRVLPARITALAFDTPARSIAVGAQDGSAVIVGRDLAMRVRLDQHTHTVHAAAFAPDGTRVATGSLDGVRLWDPATGMQTVLLTTSQNRVLGLAWSPDGRRLASAHGDADDVPGFVKVWTGR